ncbi:hypothetical protein O181_029726 [Austropuccinia psidii MF-1]|uniref:Uncharacterized protein n=1 Tax=Austropuccinia psidii MF-1 TaxID=1389203 RepID=A0A9Q3CX23_9BASI|nr:hypothetical protein [Austropuccinia psidii MF-1]
MVQFSEACLLEKLTSLSLLNSAQINCRKTEVLDKLELELSRKLKNVLKVVTIAFRRSSERTEGACITFSRPVAQHNRNVQEYPTGILDKTVTPQAQRFGENGSYLEVINSSFDNNSRSFQIKNAIVK